MLMHSHSVSSTTGRFLGAQDAQPVRLAGTARTILLHNSRNAYCKARLKHCVDCDQLKPGHFHPKGKGRKKRLICPDYWATVFICDHCDRQISSFVYILYLQQVEVCVQHGYIGHNDRQCSVGRGDLVLWYLRNIYSFLIFGIENLRICV
jgi:hypothetical protein